MQNKVFSEREIHKPSTHVYNSNYNEQRILNTYKSEQIRADQVIPTSVHVNQDVKKLPEVLHEVVKNDVYYIKNDNTNISPTLSRIQTDEFNGIKYNKVFKHPVSPTYEDQIQMSGFSQSSNQNIFNANEQTKYGKITKR